MAETENPGDTGQPTAFLADRYRNPAMTVEQPRRGNYVFSGICAVLAALAFIAILVVLWVDWTAIQAA